MYIQLKDVYFTVLSFITYIFLNLQDVSLPNRQNVDYVNVPK